MKPDRQKFLESKRRLRRHLKRVIRECEQLVIDLRSWNDNRPDAPPFDVGGDIATAALAKRILVLVESDQHIPDELWGRYVEQAEANAQ